MSNRTEAALIGLKIFRAFLQGQSELVRSSCELSDRFLIDIDAPRRVLRATARDYADMPLAVVKVGTAARTCSTCISTCSTAGVLGWPPGSR